MVGSESCACGQDHDNPALEGFFHAVFEAENAAEDIRDPFDKATAWAAIANAWGRVA